MIIKLSMFGETIDIKDQKVCLILPKGFEGKVIGADKQDIGTKFIDLYVSDNKYDTLQINSSY